MTLLIYLLVFCIVAAIAFYIIAQFAFPAPWGNVIRAIVALILLIILIEILVGGISFPIAHPLLR